MKRHLLIMLLLVFVGSIFTKAQRADYNVIPLPKEVKVNDSQVFTLSQGMGVSFDASNPEIYRNVLFMCEWVKEMTGIELRLTPNDKKAAIRMSLDLSSEKEDNVAELTEQQQEAYRIKVDKKGVVIQARKPVGFFRAAQTLRKALPVIKGGT